MMKHLKTNWLSAQVKPDVGMWMNATAQQRRNGVMVNILALGSSRYSGHFWRKRDAAVPKTTQTDEWDSSTLESSVTPL